MFVLRTAVGLWQDDKYAGFAERAFIYLLHSGCHDETSTTAKQWSLAEDYVKGNHNVVTFEQMHKEHRSKCIK